MERWGQTLAPWAQHEERSRGRRYEEGEHGYRPRYARDRDRIVHCRAFRRLEYKTQVFVNHEGDHYRTRLTHSIEVSQIARTVARALGLNGDLVEALALSHDLGHTPFGHLGEEVLDPILRASEAGGASGFDHNRQSLRIVEVLEERYPEFPGLNLTWEVREGIVKHSGPPDVVATPEAAEYLPDTPPPLEAQMIDLVDEIAYNHHDVDDGLESGLLALEQIVEAIPEFGRPYAESVKRIGSDRQWMCVKIALRQMIDGLVTDLIENTHAQIQQAGFRSVDDVRSARAWSVGLSDEVAQSNKNLKAFLHEHLYRHPRILETKKFLSKVLEQLFAAYRAGPAELPDRYRQRAEADGLDRSIADYIAGMTDRFALQEHRRLCGGPGPEADRLGLRR